MNIHNKLKKLGFRKIEPHFLDYSYKVGQHFAPYEDSLTVSPPKWTFTYIYHFSKDVKVWALVEKHSEIMMYVESTTPIEKKNRYGSISKEYITLIYSNKQEYIRNYPALTSTNDLIHFLPLAVRRDMQLSRLLG